MLSLELFLAKMENKAKEAGVSEDGQLYEALSSEYEEYKDYAKIPKSLFFKGNL